MELVELINKDKSSFNELVHKRHSERYYFAKKFINTVNKQKLDDYCATLAKGPFGTKITICSTGQFMGTYKMIHFDQDKEQCPYFYLGAILNNIEHPDKIGLVDFGYVFEKLILYAAHLGFGTCWIGGSYHADEAERYMQLEKGTAHKVICITPVGMHKKPSELDFLDKIHNKLFSGAHSRLPLNKLFFHNDFTAPLRIDGKCPDSLKYLLKESPEKKSYLELILDSFRWAPSASNSQSWRVLFMEKENVFAFFTSSVSNYYKYIDIGIGMLHWEAACVSYGMKGHWDTENIMKLSLEAFGCVAHKVGKTHN